MPSLDVVIDSAAAAAESAVALRLVRSTETTALPPFAAVSGFKGAVGTICPLPTTDGQGISVVLVGIGTGADPWALGAAVPTLPPLLYRLEAGGDVDQGEAALAFALSSYRFRRYRPAEAGSETPVPRLLWPEGVDRAALERTVRAFDLVRDLVNTPASDMGPQDLQEAAQRVAEAHGAALAVIVGDDLLDENFPALHAVGRASVREPRLLDLRWQGGAADAPLVTLVGKGVCFDTGGLSLKPAAAMKLMKKDMGGAAHALALATMIMDARLPLRLRVLIPAVENSVSGAAMRPGDILTLRNGLTVEVNNTDAEGRLVLADALAAAAEDSPALILDFATLTGAARVALGPDLPAFYTTDEALAATVARLGPALNDPVWRLPLWEGYRSQVESRIADLDNAPEGGMAGSITAALFLQASVPPSIPWAHLDLYAWSAKARPGRPQGGDAQALRPLFAALQEFIALAQEAGQ